MVLYVAKINVLQLGKLTWHKLAQMNVEVMRQNWTRPHAGKLSSANNEGDTIRSKWYNQEKYYLVEIFPVILWRWDVCFFQRIIFTKYASYFKIISDMADRH